MRGVRGVSEAVGGEGVADGESSLILLLRALSGTGLLGEEERLGRSMIGWSRSLGKGDKWKVCLLFPVAFFPCEM